MPSESVTIPLLQSIPMLHDLPPEHLGTIAGISEIVTFAEGQEMFHEGDRRDQLYVVLEGRVALEIHIPNRGRLRILTVEPMEVLGWTGMVDATSKRTATARAVAPAKLLAINADKLAKACSEDPRLGYIIMQHVANVIANRLLVTRMQLLDMFSNPPAEAAHG
jgi:CRP/FNR family transcriptional regulator, cyclic AMP receptor protein